MGERCGVCGQALPSDGGTLGNLIRKRRMSMGFTLRDVERITDGKISNGYLSQIETGKVKDPSGSMLLLISHALAMDVLDLLAAIKDTGQ